MRLAPPSLRCIATATSNTTAMSSSSRANARGRRPWGRGFCDRPSSLDGPWGGAFVSGDMHLRSVRDANYGHRQGYGGNFGMPRGGLRPPFRSRPPPVFQPPPRPPPADYRSWVSSSSPPPPPQGVRFRVLSYNILADYLARDHRSKLYFHIPPYILDWEWRKRRLLLEFGLWSPDIMCLQEVDRFQDLEQELTIQGYKGVWKMRTGNAVDGCAIFWRTNRFVLRHEEDIEFNKHGLRDNIAQICVLEPRTQSPVENKSVALPASSHQSKGLDQVIVCNTHVLYNPKRGEIKLGQVRVLLDRAYSVSRIWNDAPVVICGDFNCTPKSPLYNFISEQKLNLSGLARNEVSGQYSACIYAPRTYVGSGLCRAQPSQDNNDAKVATVEQGDSCTVIDNLHQAQKGMECASLKDSFPSPHISEKHCYYSQNESRNIKESDPMSKEVCKDLFGSHSIEFSSSLCSEMDSLKETVKGSNERCEVAADMGSEGVHDFTHPTVSCHENLFSREVEPDHGNKDVEISCSIRGMLNKQYSKSNPDIAGEHVDSLHLGTASKNEELIHGLLDSVEEVKNTSKIYRKNRTISTLQDDFVDYEVQKENVNSCEIISSFEGNIDAFSSVPFSENHLDSKTKLDNKLLDDVISDISSSEVISKTFPVNVGVSFPESTDKPSSDLVTVQEKAELDISCQNSYQSKPLDSSTCGNLSFNIELVDSSVYEVDRNKKEDASLGGDQRTICTYAKLLANITEDDSSQNVNCLGRSIEPYPEETSHDSGNTASTSGLHRSQLEDCNNNTSEITSESYSSAFGQGHKNSSDFCHLEENSDHNFLEELHGTGNINDFRKEVVSDSPFSRQTMSSFPDVHETMSFSPSPGQGVGKEGLNFGRLNSNIYHQPQLDSSGVEVQEKNIYDPYSWTPMEIEAASGNAECTLLEHNMKLKSAYTEVEDRAGTKDSSREPQVTSYNRQFMGTVDYIWCSEGLQTVKVLDTIPKHVLQQTPGFPTKKWGSDHLAIVCELTFRKGPIE